MTERKRTPEEILEELINKNIKFQVAEIVSLGAGVVGTIATLLGQHVAMATFPLSASILLNLINRRKLDQLTRQQTFLDTTEVQRRLAAEIQGVRGQLQDGGLPVGLDPENASTIQSTLDHLTHSLQALETKMQLEGASTEDTNSIAEELVQLRNHQLDLAQSLEAITQQLQAQPSAGTPGQLEQELAELRQGFAAFQEQPITATVDVDSLRNEFQGMVASLQQQIGAMEERVAFAANSEPASFDMAALQGEFQQMLLPVQQQMSVVEERVSTMGSSAASVDANALQSEFQQMLMPLQQQVAALEHHMQEQAAVSPVDGLRAELHQLVAPIENKLTAIEGRVQDQSAAAAAINVDGLRAELQGMMAPIHQQVSGIEARVSEVTGQAQVKPEDLQQVQSQMSALTEKFEHVAAQFSAEIAGFQHQLQEVSVAPAGVDTSMLQQQMQASIAPLQERLASLDQRLHSMPVIDPQVSQVQSEQMISLQNQVNSLNGYLEEISAELAKVPQMVEDRVQHKVALLQPVVEPVNPKKDAFSELDAILADINL
jgi:predicted  nucleic acid-binding Zn-ribbon protein